MHLNHLLKSAMATCCIAVAACHRAEADDLPHQTGRAGVVDTMHPPLVLLERFRDGLAPPPGMQLTGGEADRDVLVRRFVEAAGRADTLALRAMHMDRSEFAWIYFPGSPYASAPYELPPDYVWFHTMAESNTGAERVMRLLSGKRIAYRGYRCAGEPQHYGEARLWIGCTVLWRDEGGEEWDFRLFGSILEHEGQYKFVSFANKL